jgi:hypothetical protein
MIDFQKLIRALLGQPEPAQPKLKDFSSLEELNEWFLSHDEMRLPAPNLCDDYSRKAMRLAEEDGYFLSTCLVFKGTAYGAIIFANPDGSVDETAYHIANSAIVGQSVYYVDLGWNKIQKLCDFIPGGIYGSILVSPHIV